MADGTIRAFFADDHAVLRDALAAWVGNETDIEVVGQCGDGLHIMERIAECQPDVVVLDISMPGLNGLDACQEIIRRFDGVAVLMLTMHGDEQYVARALESGATGYLLKEASAEKLVEAIRRVARGDLYLGPGISPKVMERIGRSDEEPYDRLSMRERQVLQMIAEGKTNRQIGEELSLAVKTIDTHRTRLMRKLNIHDQTSLVKFAIRKGITAP